MKIWAMVGNLVQKMGFLSLKVGKIIQNLHFENESEAFYFLDLI